MNKLRVLFVDDEPAILESLEDRLIGDARRWEMVFASGGAAALEEMARKPVDVVVSDMRMPKMDGAELLNRVQKQFPGALRFVLTGHAEREAIMRVVGVAHQILAKPCDTQVLRTAIERGVGLLPILQNDTIRRLGAGMRTLPSTPALYLRLTNAAADPRSDLSTFAEIVSADTAICSKVLQLANSPYFGLRKPTTSIRDAVSYLGLELLKSFVLAANVFEKASDDILSGDALEKMQRVAVLTARVARSLLANTRQADTAFTAGLLHDVGHLALSRVMPEPYGALIPEAPPQRRLEIELTALGATHAEVGAYLLGVWGLPLPIVEAVAFHHEPARVQTENRQLVAAVYAADCLVEELIQTNHGEAMLDVELLRSAGLTESLELYREYAREAVADLAVAA